MHQVISDHLESYLSGSEKERLPVEFRAHLEACEQCRQSVRQMQEQARRIGVLREAGEVEPRAGFYARVMERVNSQRGDSIWNLFTESAFGRRIALASLVLAVLMGSYLVSNDSSGLWAPAQKAQIVTLDEEQAPVVTAATPQESRDAVLVNLASYQEQ